MQVLDTLTETVSGVSHGHLACSTQASHHRWLGMTALGTKATESATALAVTLQSRTVGSTQF